MSTLYKIVATPERFPYGILKGDVVYVAVEAQSEHESILWWETDEGELSDSFRRVLPSPTAETLIAMLRTGQMVIFPGDFTREEVNYLRSARLGE